MFQVYIFGICAFYPGFSSGLLTQEKYIGSKIGEFNSYHHQVGGDVYAVDETTILLKNFIYDGNGRDTFFWAGSRPRPGTQGFIVPNEHGRTNILERYLNEDVTIMIPDGKTINDIKWLAVYDLSRLESFGDVFIPEGFEPPQRKILPRLKSRTERVSSDNIVVVDSKSILIENFNFDGRGEVYFWVGVGPQPHLKGMRIPDENGYMTPLAAYKNADVTIQLPGISDVFSTDWLALYDVTNQEILGHVIIPEELNIPPALVTITEHETRMPHCEQLHRDLQVSWEVFGGIITIEVAGKTAVDDYIAFGVSGNPSKPEMLNGDAAVMFRDTYNGYVKDYNITSYFSCTDLVGQKRGVCEDELLGGQNNYQPMSSSRKDDINVYNFRRPLVTPDAGDKVYLENGDTQIIWAMGKMLDIDINPRPAMHYAWSKYPQPINFGRKKLKNCFAFTHSKQKEINSWKSVRFTHLSTNVTFQLGPSGGLRGYEGLTKNPSVTGLAWYVDGYLIPELYLRRDTTYRFHVFGGSNPYDPANYHPLIVTDEQVGGFSQLKETKKKKVRIFAGTESTVRGDIRPVRGGDLCIWKHPVEIDRRRDIEFLTFVEFRNSLVLHCTKDTPVAGIVELTPNRSWPDHLYYNSWTGPNMGWKLHILDPEQEV